MHKAIMFSFLKVTGLIQTLRRETGLFETTILKSVNTNTLWYKNDPYVLATQTQQVFYFDDPKLGSGWKVIQKIRRRHVWDVPENEDDHDMETKYVDEEDQVEDFVELIEDENVNPGRALRRDNVEPEIHVLSDKDLEQSSSHDVDFIDDDPEDEEMLSADEENAENNEDDYDSDLD
ncbi:hypothetical protein ACLB2K_060115 [Fragaria x ananassa]